MLKKSKLSPGQAHLSDREKTWWNTQHQSIRQKVLGVVWPMVCSISVPVGVAVAVVVAQQVVALVGLVLHDLQGLVDGRQKILAQCGYLRIHYAMLAITGTNEWMHRRRLKNE